MYSDETKHSAPPQFTWLVCPNQTVRIATAVALAFPMAVSLRDTDEYSPQIGNLVAAAGAATLATNRNAATDMGNANVLHV